MIGQTQILQLMYDYLKGTPLTGAVSGELCKGNRPLNSRKEDVVINSLPLTMDQLQKCIVNVNVFVPDITVSTGEGETREPDFARLAQLEPIALQAVKEYQSLTHSFYVQQCHVIKDHESESHYLNIRVEFYAPNLN